MTPEPPIEKPRPTILVVDDNPTNLKLVSDVLEFEDYNILKAVDAEAAEHALAAIKREKPQVILLDMELPGMDGLSLVRKLKADPETRDIHIVAVTSYPERWSKAAALEAGCDAYIIKPINTRTLPQIITSAVGQSEET